MSRDPWKPEQYLRYRKERGQPFFDLLQLVRPRAGMRIVDLGCGTGELTAELHRRLNARETLGIDSFSREDVVEWLKGSLLTVYECRLTEELFSEFCDRYRTRLLARLEDTRPFFFTFKRILMWAERRHGQPVIEAYGAPDV